jgi:transcriptional regulator with XRE-family HTH domain
MVLSRLKHPSVNPLGESIRVLMNRRALNGAQLAQEIGLSQTSVSRILTGHSKPKQVTLTRLMKRLCVGADEEQMLLRAFTGTAAPSREEPVDNDAQNAAEERERVERWLEARTQAITFKKAVGRELDKTSVTYRRDVCEGIASVDFLIERGGRRIAVECKFNVARDFEKTVGIAQRLHELMRCDYTVIVVPFIDTYADQALALAPKVVVKTPAELVSFLEESA